MSKPIREIEIVTANSKKTTVNAVLDTGSFFTIIRQDALPQGAKIEVFKKKERYGTARQGGKLVVTGVLSLRMRLENHWISDEVKVAPLLGSEMLIGAKTMQSWDITIRNKNGHTKIQVGRDLYDPEIQTVL